MNGLSEKQFTDRVTHLSCCGKLCDINDLNYRKQCGFAKFRIEIINPVKELEVDKVLLLEETLNCKLRVIKAYY